MKHETRVADHYAGRYSQPTQQPNETDQEYRVRIALYLRDAKNLIVHGQCVLDNVFQQPTEKTFQHLKKLVR